MKEKTNYATISIVFGVCGLFVLPFIFGILAVIFGTISVGKENSKGYIGIILGVINIISAFWIAGLI